jgi:dGTPase
MAKAARPSKPSVPLYSANDVKRVASIHTGPGDRSEFRRDYSRLLHSPSFRRLQGKAQLLPAAENDFFRNRLTHSLEVAQIGKSIAIITNEHILKPPHQIDLDLIEFACLAHDIGHPPFGHVGEAALDKCMKEHGGFEGNAQTFRIVSRLEKKELRDVPGLSGWKRPIYEGQDIRAGLNVTYRALASILKYDHPIPAIRSLSDPLVKGYYYFDAPLVQEVRTHVLGSRARGHWELRTLECSIMDIADDVAYSTYDLEDVYKSEMYTPIGFRTLTHDYELMRAIAKRVHPKIEATYGPQESEFTAADVRHLVAQLFLPLLGPQREEHFDQAVDELAIASKTIAQDGYARTEFTSGLISRALNELEWLGHPEHPALSTVRFQLQKFKEIEVLKALNFSAIINAPVMKTIEHKGHRIIGDLFRILGEPGGDRLLPEDFRFVYERLTDPALKKRVICDFIAGMTDRFALEFHDRLVSTKPGSIYPPHS